MLPTFNEDDDTKPIVNNVASQSIVTSVLKFNPKATNIEARNSPDAQEQQQLTQVKFEFLKINLKYLQWKRLIGAVFTGVFTFY